MYIGPPDVAGLSKEEKEGLTNHKLSSLTMRFMPLIECFLSVCGATVVKPKPGGSTSEVEDFED